MSNMSYCRFYNTLGDLQDCYDAIKEGEELSQEEYRKAKALLSLCQEIAENVRVEDLKEEKDEEEEINDNIEAYKDMPKMHEEN